MASTAVSHATVRPVDLGLEESARPARPEDPPAVHIRARLDEQVRALLEHEQVALEGADPEGVHQMRVAVRRIRAALKADGADLDAVADALQSELRWLGGVLGAVRDLDVQLAYLRGLSADFDPAERDAVERLLLGLRTKRRLARRRLLTALRGSRYRALLSALADAARSEPPPDLPTPAEEPAPADQPAASLVGVIRRPYRRLRKAARALGADPADDDLHQLRIHGKRLRYAAELAAEVGGDPVRSLIKATKRLQDVLGDHQDACVAELEIRRLLSEMDTPDAEVAFAAGRLVERERGRRADCRTRWRAAVTEVDKHARVVLSPAIAATQGRGTPPQGQDTPA
jgi:CHAD domain-containing protein